MIDLTYQLRQLEKEITKHDDAAKKGPWIVPDSYDDAPYVWSKDPEELLAKTWLDDRIQGAANRDFIASARTALLDLLAVAKGLEAKLAEVTLDRNFARADLETLRADNERMVKQLNSQNK